MQLGYVQAFVCRILGLADIGGQAFRPWGISGSPHSLSLEHGYEPESMPALSLRSIWL